MSFAQQEAKSAIKEYESMVRAIELMPSNDDVTINVTTLEEDKLNVNISQGGWTVIEADGSDKIRQLIGQSYESIEALLMLASEEFCKLWNRALHERLEDFELNVKGLDEGEDS